MQEPCCQLPGVYFWTAFPSVPVPSDLLMSLEFERARGRAGEVSALISHSHSLISTFGRMPVSLTAARRQRGIRRCVPGVWNLTPMRLMPAHRMGLAALGKFTTTPRVRAPALRPGRERNTAASPEPELCPSNPKDSTETTLPPEGVQGSGDTSPSCPRL